MHSGRKIVVTYQLVISKPYVWTGLLRLYKRTVYDRLPVFGAYGQVFGLSPEHWHSRSQCVQRYFTTLGFSSDQLCTFQDLIRAESVTRRAWLTGIEPVLQD